MKGPDGLKPGMVIYTMPDLDTIADGDTLETFNCLRSIVIEWPGGRLGLVPLDPDVYRSVEKDGSFHLVRMRPIDNSVAGYAYVTLIELSDDWFHTPAEAFLSAVESEEDYISDLKHRCENARRIARGESAIVPED